MVHRVGAVVVNYQDSKATVETVRTLLDQSHPDLHLLVYDNASSPDQIAELFEGLGDLGFSEVGGSAPTRELRRSASKHRVIVLEAEQNLGPGAAFADGARFWEREGFDLVWYLDDDMHPTRNCLEKMIETWQRSSAVSKTLVVPLRVDTTNGLAYPMFGFDPRQGVRFVDVNLLDDGSPVDMAPYAGMLGPPALMADLIPTEFFIDSCDFAMSRRIWRKGGTLLLARRAFALHDSGGKPAPSQVLGVERHLRIPTSFRFYYLARNKFVFYKEAARGPFSLWRFYFRDLAELSILALYSKSRRQNFANIIRGFLDGIAGSLGIRPDRAVGQPPIKRTATA